MLQLKEIEWENFERKMTQTLKIAIPMAGFGSRLRPHTWSKPKPLLKIAGITVLDYVLAQYSALPQGYEAEYVFIISPHQETQIKEYMQVNHPDMVVHYAVQEEMLGQSHALYQAKEYLTGPMLMAFSDTLIEIDLSFLEKEIADGVAVVKRVPDPRRFGAAQTDANGRVTRLVEKPQDINLNLVVVGFYYFKEGKDLLTAIEEQMQQNITLKNEFFLADAVNLMLDKGYHMRVEEIETWLDAGTPEAMFETNEYLLGHGYDNSQTAAKRPGVAIVPPVFVHESAQIESSVIGPNVSIGAGCVLKDVVLSNSIIDDNTHISRMLLKDSLIGQHAELEGRPISYNLGDNAWVKS